MKRPSLKQPGDFIDQYRVERILGQGCEGDAYCVKDCCDGGRRSLKLLRGRNLMAEFDCAVAYYQRLRSVHAFKRFRGWGKLLNQPSVGARPYLVFDYVAGCTLPAYLKRQGVNPERLVLALCDAVAQVHQTGLGVGDFDNGRNVLIERDSGRVVLCDANYGEAGRLNTDRKADVDEVVALSRMIYRRCGVMISPSRLTALVRAKLGNRIHPSARPPLT